MSKTYQLTAEQERVWESGVWGLWAIEQEVADDLRGDGALADDVVDVLTADGQVAFTVWELKKCISP